MNIDVKVITNAKKREISVTDSSLKVKLKSLPRDGRANEELIEYLAECFCVRKSDIHIVRGERERKKVISLPVDDAVFKTFIDEKVKVTTG